MNKESCERFVFYADTLACTFCLAREKGCVLLYGEEAENGKTVFSLMLSFSLRQERKVKSFVRTLVDSETFPRMMAELAEDYFS